MSKAIEFLLTLNAANYVAGMDKLRKTTTDAQAAVVAAVNDMSKGLKITEANAEALAETMGSVKMAGKAIGAGVLAAAAAAALSAGSWSSYAQKMAEVNTLVDTSPQKFEMLSDSVRQSSVKLGKSATESATALYDIISAGVGVGEAVGVMEQATQAAVAGVTDTQTAVRGGMSVINAYGQGVGKLGSAYDVLFQVVKGGITTFPELSAYLGEVLPTANAAGVEFEEVGASIATMTKAGIRTPQAVTALNGAIRALAAPAPEAKVKMAELGIEWKGLTETLGDIGKMKLSVAEMREIIPDTEASKAVLALTNNFDGLIKSLDEMHNSAGATKAAYLKMKDTPQAAWNRFQATVGELSLSLGHFVTNLQPVLEGGTALLQQFNHLPEPVKAVAMLMGTGAVGATGFAVAFMKLSDAARLVGVYNAGVVISTQAATAAAGTGAAANLGLSASYAAVAASAKAALLAIAPVAASVVVASTVAAGFVLYAKQQADAAKEQELAMTDLAKAVTGLGDAQRQLNEIGYGESKAAASVARLKELGAQLAQAQKMGVDVDTTAYANAANAAKQGVAEILNLEKSLAAEKENLEKLEEQKRKQTLDSMATYERLFKEEVWKLSGEALQKKIDDAQRELEATRNKLQQAVAAEQQAHEKVIQLETNKAAQAQSTADKIREVKRRGMTEEAQQADIKKQANEKAAAAELAMINAVASGSPAAIQAARSLAKEAEGMYFSLKDGAAAEKGIKKVGGVLEELAAAELKAGKEAEAAAAKKTQALQEQVTQLEGLVNAAKEKLVIEMDADISAAEAKIDEINEKLKKIKMGVDITDATSKMDEILAKFDKLKDKTITITTRMVEARSGGGPILGLARGAWLPGYGGGDKIQALLEAGEFVNRKESVRKYGGDIFAALNAMRVDPAALRALVTGRMYQFGGPVLPRVSSFLNNIHLPAIPPILPLRLATGGPVQTHRIEFGPAAIESNSPAPEVEAFIDQFRRAAMRM